MVIAGALTPALPPVRGLVDPSSSSYQTGYVMGRVLVVALIVGVLVWLLRSVLNDRRAKRPDAPFGDLATLGRFVRLYMPFDAAADLVGRVFAHHPAATPAAGPTPAWFLLGEGHLVVALVPRDGAAVLQVAEVELPLRSPQPAAGWAWTLATVQEAAASAGIRMATGQHSIVPVRQLGPTTSVGAPVAG